MPTALKGAGWRSSQSRRTNGNSVQQNEQKEGTKKCRSPIPKYILGKPSPRDYLPHIHDLRRGDDKEKMQSDGKRNNTAKLSENRIDTNNNAREYEEEGDEREGDEREEGEEEGKEGEEEEGDVSIKNVNSNRPISKNDRVEMNNNNKNEMGGRSTRLPKELSSTQGAGYCRKVVQRSEKSFPKVPHYGTYSNLLPDSYKMPWRQDMKNRSAILANVRSAGKDALPNIEHNDYLFLRHREQFSPNVEKTVSVEKKQSMPSIEKILNPAFHHHTIKTKASQRKAIFPAAPSMHFHHPRLRHVTGCYACEPDYDE